MFDSISLMPVCVIWEQYLGSLKLLGFWYTFHQPVWQVRLDLDNIHGFMEVSVIMAPKTSKSQVGAYVCCGWGNCHMLTGSCCKWTSKQKSSPQFMLLGITWHILPHNSTYLPDCCWLKKVLLCTCYKCMQCGNKDLCWCQQINKIPVFIKL